MVAFLYVYLVRCYRRPVANIRGSQLPQLASLLFLYKVLWSAGQVGGMSCRGFFPSDGRVVLSSWPNLDSKLRSEELARVINICKCPLMALF